MSDNNSGTDAEGTGWIEVEESTVRYNPSTETYRTVYNWSQNNTLTETLLSAVDAVIDEQSTDLPPLFEYVDPDALENLFEPTTEDSNQRTSGRLSFPYVGFLMTIHADGEITFQKISPS